MELNPSLITEAELQELAAIEAESIGWQPLGEGGYLHVGQPDEAETIITVTGAPIRAWRG